MASGLVTTPGATDKEYSFEGITDEPIVNGQRHQHPPIKPLQETPEPWESLFIPKLLESKLIEFDIKSAHELVKLFHTESGLEELLTMLFPNKDKEQGLNIIQRRKFITSALDYYQHSYTSLSPNNFPRSSSNNIHNIPKISLPNIYSQQEAQALAKLNKQEKANRKLVEMIEEEKQNIYTLCEAAQKSMSEDLQELKQKINEFESNFTEKLLEIKKFKLNTLDEKAVEVNDFQQKIEQCKHTLHTNISSNSFAGDVNQRTITNVNMVNTTLKQTISPFTKTMAIEEIANEQRAVKQALHFLSGGPQEDPELPPDLDRIASRIPANLDPTDDGGCSVVPQQIGTNVIELYVGLNISYDIPEDDSKEDAIIFQLEMHHKKQWKTLVTQTSNEPTTRFELKGLKKQGYSIRIKYFYKSNGKQQERVSAVQSISLGTAVVWNTRHHGANVTFPDNHKLKCISGRGSCSVAMDPMVISGKMFSRIIIGLEIHSYGGKSCFGFLDESKWKRLMNGLWNNCFLHCIRDNNQGIYGLSTYLNQKQIFYCNNGSYRTPIKVSPTRNGDKYIFEVIFGQQNYCNVYKNSKQHGSLLLSGNDKVTFANIPGSIVFVYSHEDYGESEVSIKVIEVEFKK